MYLNFDKAVERLGFEGHISTYAQKLFTEDFGKRLITIRYLRRIQRAKTQDEIKDIVKSFNQIYERKQYSLSVEYTTRARKVKRVHFYFEKGEVTLHTEYRCVRKC